MENVRHHFYFAIAIIAIVSVSGFMMIQVENTMVDLALIEGSFYGIVRNGDARLSSELDLGIKESDIIFDKEMEEIDLEINNL